MLPICSNEAQEDDEDDEVADLQGQEEPTPVCAQRHVARCLPCLGQGTIRVVAGARETLRACPLCRGTGSRVMLLRGAVEVFVADEMKVADLGRCKGAFHPGRRAAFGRVVCPVCGGRFRPLPGLRVPNHVAVRPTPQSS